MYNNVNENWDEGKHAGNTKCRKGKEKQMNAKNIGKKCLKLKNALQHSIAGN